MKSLYVVFPLLVFLTFNAKAEIQLTQEDIQGAWSVDQEALSIHGKNANRLKTVWTFGKDGVLTGVSKDSQRHARMSSFRAKLNYRIEDGKLVKQSAPGRSKEETCVAVQKEGEKMILKCKNIFFFMTKK